MANLAHLLRVANLVLVALPIAKWVQAAKQARVSTECSLRSPFKMNEHQGHPSAIDCGCETGASLASRRFRDSVQGATAVEFALVASPFLLLLSVFFEISLITLSQQTLDLAVERAARQLRTGTFQNDADGSDANARFQRVLCNGAFIMFSCDDLRVEVTSRDIAVLPVPTEPYNSSTKGWSDDFGKRFECPKGSDVIAVRAAVPVPRLLWFLDFTGKVMQDRKQLLIATNVSQAESYDETPCQ